MLRPSTPPVGILRTKYDDHYSAALKNKLLDAEQYKIGDTVRYSKNGHTEFATYEDIELENTCEAPKYVLRLDDSQRTITADKEFVQPIDVPDISDTSLSENQVKQIFQELSGAEIQQLFGLVYYFSD